MNQSTVNLYYIERQAFGDKITFTVTLTCQEDGTKLPDVIVFSGSNKVTGVLSDKLLSDLEVPWNVIVKSSAKGWWNSRLHMDYLNPFFSKTAHKKYLFVDRFPVHMKEELIFQKDERNMERIPIPGGMSGQFQPLDVGVNKPFKDFYHQEFHRWPKTLKDSDKTKKGNIWNPTCQEVTDFVSRAWEKIPESVVRKVFNALESVEKNGGYII